MTETTTHPHTHTRKRKAMVGCQRRPGCVTLPSDPTTHRSTRRPGRHAPICCMRLSSRPHLEWRAGMDSSSWKKSLRHTHTRTPTMSTQSPLERPLHYIRTQYGAYSRTTRAGAHHARSHGHQGGEHKAAPCPRTSLLQVSLAQPQQPHCLWLVSHQRRYRLMGHPCP